MADIQPLQVSQPVTTPATAPNVTISGAKVSNGTIQSLIEQQTANLKADQLIRKDQQSLATTTTIFNGLGQLANMASDIYKSYLNADTMKAMIKMQSDSTELQFTYLNRNADLAEHLSDNQVLIESKRMETAVDLGKLQRDVEIQKVKAASSAQIEIAKVKALNSQFYGRTA